MYRSNSVKMTALALAMSVAGTALAVPHDFQSGSPVRASEMNANFQDVESQIAEAIGGAILTADCGLDSGALQAAIDSLPEIGGEITFSGQCDAIDIGLGSRIRLVGGTNASILATSTDVAAIQAIGSTLQFENFSVDAGGAESGIDLGGSLAQLADITAVNAGDGNLLAFGNSTVTLQDVTIGDSDDFVGILMGESSLVAVVGGTNVLNGENALEVEFAGVFIQDDGSLTANGRIDAVENSIVFLQNATVDGDIYGQQNASITLEPDGGDQSISVTGDVRLSMGSNLLAANDDGGSLTLGGGEMFIMNSYVVLRNGSTSHSPIQLHRSSSLELDQGASTTSTDIQLHSFSILQDNTGTVATSQVTCFGTVIAFAFGDVPDLCI